MLSHQEDVGQYGVLEGGVSQGVDGGDGAGRDAVQPLQDVVPQVLKLDHVTNKPSCNDNLCYDLQEFLNTSISVTNTILNPKSMNHLDITHALRIKLEIFKIKKTFEGDLIFYI